MAEMQKDRAEDLNRLEPDIAERPMASERA